MIDPLLSLAFEIHSAKGVYALLLGSGVSRGAGIPTGWDVVQDLCRKLAALLGEKCGDDPAAWYHGKFGKDPDYSELLNELGSTPGERRNILTGYFEPTEKEREDRKKLPTAAHRAIAKLVASGHIRCIVTTNFDRLMEQAIGDAGVRPTVVSTPDGIKGAVPLTHAQCYVFKIHGDYLDTRIRNVTGELAKYDLKTRRLLDRILDEFGLIVCGWSADWDTALYAGIERCPSRRFSTYWAFRGKPSRKAESLIAIRGAKVLGPIDADTLFVQIAEKVDALEQLEADHPLSASIAVAMVKKLVSESRLLPRLSDLLASEAEHVYLRTEPLKARLLGNEAIDAYLIDCTSVMQTYWAALAEACFWAKGEHHQILVAAIQNMIRMKPPSGRILTDVLEHYPAASSLYVAGVSALANDNYTLLRSLFDKLRLRRHDDEDRFVCLYPWQQLHEVARQLPKYRNHSFPFSEFMHDAIRLTLRQRLPDDASYDDRFDRFEYFLAIGGYSYNKRDYWMAPVGRWIWKPRYVRGKEVKLNAIIAEEADSLGDDSPPLHAGLFGGSIEGFKRYVQRYTAQINRQQ
jgi:hypothetical protein